MVNILSTYSGKLPKTTVKRFERKQKPHVDVDCPNVITECNRHMGDVYLMDRLIGRYEIKVRSKKMVHKILQPARSCVSKFMADLQKISTTNGRKQFSETCRTSYKCVMSHVSCHWPLFHNS